MEKVNLRNRSFAMSYAKDLACAAIRAGLEPAEGERMMYVNAIKIDSWLNGKGEEDDASSART